MVFKRNRCCAHYWYRLLIQADSDEILASTSTSKHSDLISYWAHYSLPDKLELYQNSLPKEDIFSGIIFLWLKLRLNEFSTLGAAFKRPHTITLLNPKCDSHSKHIVHRFQWAPKKKTRSLIEKQNATKRADKGFRTHCDNISLKVWYWRRVKVAAWKVLLKSERAGNQAG